MLSNLLGRKRLAFLFTYLGAGLAIILASMSSLSIAHAQGRLNAPFAVKVLIITMFPPERDAWLHTPGSNWREVSRPIGAIDDEYGVVYCMVSGGRCNGIYLTMTGTEKVNAATSMMAVLRDPDLSFKGAYFLTTGTASTSPYSEGTLGFVAWSNWIADRDQGTHVIPTTGYPHGYRPPDTSFPDNTADFHLNTDLVDKAYNLTRGLGLIDSSAAQEERAMYPGQAGRKPFVAMCDTITSDSYIVGSLLSRQTKYITKTVTDTATPAKYCTMEDEDTAVAGALNRLSSNNSHPLQCYLNLRGASAFDQPHTGQSVQEFINAHFRANNIALDNLLEVGSVVINKLLLRHSCPND